MNSKKCFMWYCTTSILNMREKYSKNVGEMIGLYLHHAVLNQSIHHIFKYSIF